MAAKSQLFLIAGVTVVVALIIKRIHNQANCVNERDFPPKIILDAKDKRKERNEKARKRANELVLERMKKMEETAKKNLIIKCESVIDYYIRTDNKFNASKPLEYECKITTLISECEDELINIIDQLIIHLQLHDLNHGIDGGVGLLSEDEERIQGYGVNFTLKHSNKFIINDRDQTVRVKYLTPFQGSSSLRMYGEFKCRECYRTWSSEASWRDKWQMCQNCEHKIYPFQQTPLKDSEDNQD